MLTKTWQRRSATHSFQWNTYSCSDVHELRREFDGVIRPDPVTGKPSLYYPGWKRRLWYILSFLVMLPLLSLGVVAMTLSLNLNGYVTSKESPIYVGRLASFAQPVRPSANHICRHNSRKVNVWFPSL